MGDLTVEHIPGRKWLIAIGTAVVTHNAATNVLCVWDTPLTPSGKVLTAFGSCLIDASIPVLAFALPQVMRDWRRSASIILGLGCLLMSGLSTLNMVSAWELERSKRHAPIAAVRTEPEAVLPSKKSEPAKRTGPEPAKPAAAPARKPSDIQSPAIPHLLADFLGAAPSAFADRLVLIKAIALNLVVVFSFGLAASQKRRRNSSSRGRRAQPEAPLRQHEGSAGTFNGSDTRARASSASSHNSAQARQGSADSAPRAEQSNSSEGPQKAPDATAGGSRAASIRPGRNFYMATASISLAIMVQSSAMTPTLTPCTNPELPRPGCWQTIVMRDSAPMCPVPGAAAPSLGLFRHGQFSAHPRSVWQSFAPQSSGSLHPDYRTGASGAPPANMAGRMRMLC